MQILEKIDLFGQPVTLTLNGKKHYTTHYSAIASFLFYSGVIVFSSWFMHDKYGNQELRNWEQKFWTPYSDDNPPYNISTKDATLAVAITGIENANKYLRVVFLQEAPYEPLDYVKKYIPAVNCSSDYFADEINQDEDSKAFFDNAWRGPHGKVKQFLCPDTSQLVLQNWNYIFYAKIYACEVAV